MPPKAAKGQPSKKVVAKEKQKIIEDKTFGLKNKKSAKVQKYVAGVQNQVNQGGQKKKKPEEPQKKKKEVEQEKKEELSVLFKPVVSAQKVPVGVDPKSILCEHFKLGTCTKGAKCKFSHDLEISRKVEKIDIYSDTRDDERLLDTMDKWDQEKLEQVVSSKDTTITNKQTDIVCKYFLEAIETKKYGWFWVCPNQGEKCTYRHRLPPGFQLKTKKKEEENDEEKDLLEDFIENKRKELKTGTPVTLELFKKWKEEKRKDKEKLEREKNEREPSNKMSGRAMMSGLQMFEFNPDLFVDDEEALNQDDYVDHDDDFDPNVPHNIVTVTDTSITLTRVHPLRPKSSTEETSTTTTSNGDDENGNDENDNNNNNNNNGDATASSDDEDENLDTKDVPVDESLFLDENVEIEEEEET